MSNEVEAEQPPSEPRTIEEFLWHIMHYKNETFFLGVRNGSRVPVPVSELTPKEFGQKIGTIAREYFPENVAAG